MVMVLRFLSFDVNHITIFKNDVTMMKNKYFGLNLFDVVCITIFKSDVILMKYVIRVKPF